MGSMMLPDISKSVLAPLNQTTIRSIKHTFSKKLNQTTALDQP